jgi:DNA helicase II / ATP-dependent DNA helicase PcrA
MVQALANDGALAGLSLKGLAGRDGSPDHLNLLTLHSAKGCEYACSDYVGHGSRLHSLG